MCCILFVIFVVFGYIFSNRFVFTMSLSYLCSLSSFVLVFIYLTTLLSTYLFSFFIPFRLFSPAPPFHSIPSFVFTFPLIDSVFSWLSFDFSPYPSLRHSLSFPSCPPSHYLLLSLPLLWFLDLFSHLFLSL